VPVPVAVVDANVLYSIELTDLLLMTATHRLVRMHWSVEILDEVRRNLQQRRELSEDAIDYRIDRMNTAVPDALAAAPVDLAASMPVNEKDRHVLALAVNVEASIIVTSNLRDFPAAACEPYGVEAVTPDQYLSTIAGTDPTEVRDVLGEIAARRTRPAMTPGEHLDRLTARSPQFDSHMRPCWQLTADRRRERRSSPLRNSPVGSKWGPNSTDNGGSRRASTEELPARRTCTEVGERSRRRSHRGGQAIEAPIAHPKVLVKAPFVGSAG
jgi:predicted nucleic acid-binding protein